MAESRIDVSFQVYGLKEALRELNSISQKLRKEVTREYKTILQPVIEDAVRAIPVQAPLSGMDRAWKTKSGYQMLPGKAGGGWSATIAGRMVKPKINTRAIRDYGGQRVNVGTFRLVWLGAANSVYDMAGRRSANRLARNLEARWGRASRVIWPAWEQNQSSVMMLMEGLVKNVAEIVSRNLAVERKYRKASDVGSVWQGIEAVQ